MRKIIYLFFMGAFCTLMMTSCLKNNTDTIILPELIVNEQIPTNIIPEAIRKDFESHMTIYEGAMPPNIQGQYLLSDYLLKYTSDGQFSPGTAFADRYIAFFNQVTGQCGYAGRQSSSIGTSDKVYISGEGNNFTAYYIAEVNNPEEGTHNTTSTLVSGTMTSEGIRNCQYAFIMLDKYDPNSKMMDINEYRIFYDADGLSENYEWYDTSSKAPRRKAPANDVEQSELSEIMNNIYKDF